MLSIRQSVGEFGRIGDGWRREEMQKGREKSNIKPGEPNQPNFQFIGKQIAHYAEEREECERKRKGKKQNREAEAS